MIAPQVLHQMAKHSQSLVLGAPTLVVRNVIAKHVSGLALLVTYRVFATKVWKSTHMDSNNFSQS